MAQQLRALAALPEDLSSNLSTSQLLVTLVEGNLTSSSDLYHDQTHRIHRYTCRQNTHKHK